MIKVKTNNIYRKSEYMQSEIEFQTHLDTILEHFDIQGNITGMSYDGGTKYGVYCSGIPDVSPVDFTGVETDSLVNDLFSFKIDLADNSIITKVYYVGNNNNVTLDNGRPVAGTGIYIGEDSFTVYYPTEGDIPTENISDIMTQDGFSATTFYADGTSSDESVYTQADAE
jgi:hypothetical protein